MGIPNGTKSATLTSEEQEMLKDVTEKRRIPGISRSQDFDTLKTSSSKHNRLSRSSSHSPGSGSRELLPFSRVSSGINVIDFGIDKKKALDVIDRVDSVR